MAIDYKLPEFDDQKPEYKHGFEAGLVWAVLAGPVESAEERLSYVVHRVNRTFIEVMAEMTGWTVSFERATDPDWCTASFERAKPRLSIVRPEGEG